MIEVILYRKDASGRLTLQERQFAGHQQLSSYLSSPMAARWDWAEIEISPEPSRLVVRHNATKAIRSNVIASFQNPPAN